MQNELTVTRRLAVRPIKIRRRRVGFSAPTPLSVSLFLWWRELAAQVYSQFCVLAVLRVGSSAPGSRMSSGCGHDNGLRWEKLERNPLVRQLDSICAAFAFLLRCHQTDTILLISKVSHTSARASELLVALVQTELFFNY